MFLLGMGLAALAFGLLLADFTKFKLIQVVQGAAVVTLVLNLVAIWRQEKLIPVEKKNIYKTEAAFIPIMGLFLKSQGGRGLLLVVFFGTLGLSMQDILLEPYGGEILGLSVAATTNLTAVWVFGALVAVSYTHLTLPTSYAV